MKRAFFFAAAAAISILAVSCSKEESKEVQTFKASAEQTSETSKVSLSGLSLRWSAGDQISVYDAAANNGVYALSSGEGTNSGEFAYSSGSSVSAAPFSAVYPAAIRTGATTVSLPATQSSTDGGLQALPMYAVGDDMELKFHHLCGVVRFRLSASSAVSLSSIAVATAGRNTNGSATVSGSGSSVTLGTLGGTATTTLSLGTAQGIASAKDFYMFLPAGSYSSFVITMTAEGGATCTKTANSAIVIERGKITTITLSGLSFGASVPTGALPGDFTVASGRTVKFSQGNLQYIGSAATPYWKFAEHQYDILGTTTGQNSAAANVDRDLFGWGTSGWNNGNTYYQPYNTSNTGDYSDGYGYGPMDGSSCTYNLTGSYANADWGVYNAISNGGNAAGLWRTLTVDEWDYLLNTRANAWFKAGYATVAGVNGVILLPDSFTDPKKNNGSGEFVSWATTGWSANVYSAGDWDAMQSAGAVFLPAAGYRNGAGVSYVGAGGSYWSSSYSSSGNARFVSFDSDDLLGRRNYGRYYGLSVRLVRG